MNENRPVDPSQLSLLELFRAEIESQTAILNAGLLELERSPDPQSCLQSLMRSAHSLKGAAKIVQLPEAVTLAHKMEDCFVAAQEGRLSLKQSQIDVLLRSTDLLSQLAKKSDEALATWAPEADADIKECLSRLSAIIRQGHNPADAPEPKTAPTAWISAAPARGDGSDASNQAFPVPLLTGQNDSPERVVRLTAESLNRLLGLAGESLVESRWLRPFSDSLQKLKRRQTDISQRMGQLRHELEDFNLPEPVRSQFHILVQELSDNRQFLADKMQELDVFDRRSAQLSHRLYLEVLRTRMRPFGDGVRRFPRMVRDLARALGKQVRLEITGESTQVDRDILERLEMPLAHLFRNAVDHGCEVPALRARSGKPAESTIRLDARHSAGMLVVTVTDDGAGVDIEMVRDTVLKRSLARPAAVRRLSESELLQFLFLPGFTLRESVTDISGRGVGLDVVQNMVRSLRGAIRIYNQPGKGLRIQLHLPLTLSVVRALLVEVDGEPYAIPLSQIQKALKLQHSRIDWLEGRHHFRLGDEQIGLLSAQQILGQGESVPQGDDYSVVVLGDRSTRYGVVVDQFLGERELVVQPLDPRLGKVKNVSAAALMEDGEPVLILDVEEMIRSIDDFVAETPHAGIARELLSQPVDRVKRVLAVDDSQTVRELQRKILTRHGYLADVAIDGLDAWNAVRTGQYDMVITDIDLPRLDGLALIRRIREDAVLRKLPILILSYKEGELDRLRGLESGADAYLTKSTFDDEVFIRNVARLIGSPGAGLVHSSAGESSEP